MGQNSNPPNARMLGGTKLQSPQCKNVWVGQKLSNPPDAKMFGWDKNSNKFRKSKLTKNRIKNTYAFDTNSGLKFSENVKFE